MSEFPRVDLRLSNEDIADDLGIPKKCRGCPRITSIIEHIGRTKRAAMDDMELAMGGGGDAVDDLVEIMTDVIGIPVNRAIEIREEALRSIGQAAAAGAELCDDMIGEFRSLIEGLTDDCSGRLTLRAARDGMEYTVGVCASPEAVDRCGCDKCSSAVEPAMIDRRRLP